MWRRDDGRVTSRDATLRTRLAMNMNGTGIFQITSRRMLRPHVACYFMSMIAFPRMMIFAAGATLIVILTFAGSKLFPEAPRLAGGIGDIIGCAINMVIQVQLYRA